MDFGQGGGRADTLVELVDMFPTLQDLAGAPVLNPALKSEPPLGGRSLRPVLEAHAGRALAAPSSVPLLRAEGLAPATGFNASFSQYGRFRCLQDLFSMPGRGKKGNCTAAEAKHFMGTSVRFVPLYSAPCQQSAPSLNKHKRPLAPSV